MPIAQDQYPPWPTRPPPTPVQGFSSPGGAPAATPPPCWNFRFNNGTPEAAFSGSINVVGTAALPSLSLTNINVPGTIAAGGNVSGSNLTTPGNISASGSVLGSSFSTSGSIVVGGTIAPITAGAPVIVQGVTNGAAASAGQVGEYLIASATGVALTTAVNTNVASITLTPGDWEVSGMVKLGGTGTGIYLVCGVSTTSATLPTPGAVADGASYAAWFSPTNVANAAANTLNPVRMLVSANTTIYLVAIANFSSGTGTASGHIAARRVR